MIEECGELVGRDKYSDADGWYGVGIEFCERQKVASSRLLHVDLAISFTSLVEATGCMQSISRFRHLCHLTAIL